MSTRSMSSFLLVAMLIAPVSAHADELHRWAGMRRAPAADREPHQLRRMGAVVPVDIREAQGHAGARVSPAPARTHELRRMGAIVPVDIHHQLEGRGAR